MIIHPLKDKRIKDAQFRQYMYETFGEEFDTDNVDGIFCPERNIRSLAGIELFTKLRGLTCNNNQIKYLNLSNNPLMWLDCENNPIERYERPLYVNPHWNCFTGYLGPRYKGLGITYDEIHNEKISKEDFFQMPYLQKTELTGGKCADCVHLFSETVETYSVYPDATDTMSLIIDDTRRYCALTNEEITDYWDKEHCPINGFSSDSHVIYEHVNTLLSAYKDKKLDDSVLKNKDIRKFSFIKNWERIVKPHRYMSIVYENHDWKRISLQWAKQNKNRLYPCYKCGSTDYIWADYYDPWWQSRGDRDIAICPHCKRQIYEIENYIHT